MTYGSSGLTHRALWCGHCGSGGGGGTLLAGSVQGVVVHATADTSEEGEAKRTKTAREWWVSEYSISASARAEWEEGDQKTGLRPRWMSPAEGGGKERI
jgi:hypothetical protein